MPPSTRPLLVVYVAWHPAFAEGMEIAQALYDHFRRKLYENVAGGTGLSVIFRWSPAIGSNVPLPIDFSEAETSAIVLLVDRHLVNDPAWVTYIRELLAQAEAGGLGTRVFPVAINHAVLGRIGIEEQAVRWDRWEDITPEEQRRRLIRELTYEFCRMLRHYLERLKHPTEEETALDSYLHKVQIFLSHSKHDEDGERIAHLIRDRLHGGQGLASFFDVHDIPAGLSFKKVLFRQLKVSAVVAVHTDSYSSREWCRREIIEAKRWNVPLVVANCISNLDERGFPYMGNVPIVRMDPYATDRIDYVVGCLLDEVLKDFLWRCRVELARTLARTAADPPIVFLPRPPELITLTGLPELANGMVDTTIVYPDPPLGAEEERLFERIAPKVRLRSITEWLAGYAL